MFRLFEPWIPRGHRPVVVGSIPELGEWEPNDAVYLTAMEDGWWAAAIDLPTTDGLAYKYVIVAPDGTVRWEPGADRTLPAGFGEFEVVDHGIDGLGGWRGAGVSVPVSALRTRTSLGIGQFTDLMPLAQWASSVGLSVIQILPVNDTIEHHDDRDAAPYDPISVNALHPVYLDLRELVAHHPEAADRLGVELDAVEARFSVHADRGEVMDTKWTLAAQCFEIMIEHDAAAVAEFVAAEWAWLGDYAAWCVLRDAYGTPDPAGWGIDAVHHPDKVAAMADPSAGTHRSMAFHCWLQYHLHRQFDTAVEFAEMAGVRLMVDVTFGVSTHSVETWAHPEAFRADRSVGAPPDAFADGGQNWRFPAWDWDHATAWWRRRLEGLDADVFRLDHVLGFFRTWEIPSDADDARLGGFHPCLPLGADDLPGFDPDALATPEGDDSTDVLLVRVEGGFHPRAAWHRTERWRSLDPDQQAAFDAIAVDFFHHRHAERWRAHGVSLLETLLDATPMLATAEDLGMVPDFMAATLAELGILGLRVERMPSDGWIADPADSPYLAVVTTGTHDMDVVRAWWAQDRDTVRRYWREALGQEGEPPGEAGPGICAAIVGRHLSSPAMLCVLPIQDLLAVDPATAGPDPDAERINRPGVPDGQWRWRMHLGVEDLLMATDLNTKLRSMISGSGR